MNNRIAVVYSWKKSGCRDTAKVLAALAFLLAGQGPAIEYAKQDGVRATELWKLAAGMYDQDLDGHYPLVCILSPEGKVISAAVEPDADQLTEMLTAAGIQVSLELPDSFLVLARLAKPVPAAS